jgi:hypothetical protein
VGNVVSCNSGQRPLVGSCECGDEPTGSGAMQLNSSQQILFFTNCNYNDDILLNVIHFSLLSKNKSKLIKSSVCLCVPLITFEPLGRFS